MKKCILSVTLFMFLGCVGISANVFKNVRLGVVSKFSGVNIYEGCLFNDYFMSYYGILLETTPSFGSVGIEPYFYFNHTESYYEKGVNFIFKKETNRFSIDLNPFYVSWDKKGNSEWGFAFWGLLTYRTSIVDLKGAYVSVWIKDRHDLSGNLYRFTIEKVLGLRKFGKVGINLNLIHNNGFFEDRPARFIYTAGMFVKNMGFLLPVETEFFVVYAYSTDVINKIMVGIRMGVPLISKGNQ